MRLLPALLIASLLVALPAAPAAAAATCDVVAAPGGSDRAAGTAADPLRTAQAVVDRAGPGQTGCLRAGTYSGRRDADYYVARFNHGGRRGRPLTLRSYPGERATLSGVVYVPKHSDDVTVSDLVIDDPTSYDYAGEITVMVDAARTHFVRDEITNHSQKTCMLLGIKGWGRARDTVVRDSVLHDCGDWGNGVYDHAIYASYASGLLVEGNVIRRASGYGVHLYPDTQGAVVRDNVIVDNGGGVIFAGEGRRASNHIRVTGNVVAGSSKRPDISSYWGHRVGRDNVARDNCTGAPVEEHVGFALRGNVVGRASLSGDGHVLDVGTCGAAAAAVAARHNR